MNKIFSWIKSNILTVILIVIILFLIGSRQNSSFGVSNMRGVSSLSVPTAGGVSEMAYGDVSQKSMAVSLPQPDFTPQADVTNRMVIQNSDMSLLVKDVPKARDEIINFAQDNGGYMVNSSISNPTDAPSATVIIRVKSAKIKQALEYFRSIAVKVVSENLEGYDVTDQYVDVEKRIAILEESKVQIQNILKEAREISDISNLTQQILNLQSQIDSYKGQQESLAKNADLAKISIYLSTDEIALPYAPSDTFRPAVIFKLAIRSLVSDLRGLATKAIWMLVYGVIWIPIVILAYLGYNFYQKRKSVKPSRLN